MSSTTLHRSVPHLPFRAALVGLAVLAALPSLIGIPGRWLWLDELLSANFSMHGPWATFATVLRFDVHPPLYYLQLSLWMLPAQSDAWLMANSVLWHAVAVVLLTSFAASRYGSGVGLGAGLLLAVSPAALAYADQVRMYAFLMALIVWAWHAQTRWLEGRGGRFGWLLMVLSQAAVANSQTAGLVMLSGCVVLGATTVLAGGHRHRVVAWLLIEAAVAALSLIPLTVSTLRGVVHLGTPGPAEIVAVLGFLTGGSGAFWPVAFGLGVVVFAGLLMAGVRDRRLARDALALIVVPILLAGLLSHLHKPVWIERLFVPVIPFICLCFARAALEREAVPIGRWLVVMLAATWAALATMHQLPRGKGDGYRLVAEAVRNTARPGDLLLTESDFSYWSVLWYLAGPRWGEPRQAYIPNADWERLPQRLPASITGVLGLGQADITRQVDGITVALWDRRGPSPETSGHVYRLQLPGGAPAELPGRTLAQRTPLQQLVLERWDRLP